MYGRPAATDFRHKLIQDDLTCSHSKHWESCNLRHAPTCNVFGRVAWFKPKLFQQWRKAVYCNVS